MIIDKQNLFDEDLAITDTANSTNVIDLGADHARVATSTEKNAEILAQVTTAFAGATSMQVSLYTDSAVGMGTESLLIQSGVIAEASLVAGYQFNLGRLPEGAKRYLRMTYTVVGTHSAGNLTSGLILDKQTNV